MFFITKIYSHENIKNEGFLFSYWSLTNFNRVAFDIFACNLTDRKAGMEEADGSHDERERWGRIT